MRLASSHRRAELDALAKQNPHIEIYYTLTRATRAHTWNGRVGRIDAELLQVSAGTSDGLFYLCGTPQLIAHSTQKFESLGVTPDRILHESFKGYARRASQ